MTGRFTFRPWGRPAWLREKFSEPAWSVVACLGTEKRSVKSAINCVRPGDYLTIVRVDDPPTGTEEEVMAMENAYSANSDLLKECCKCDLEVLRGDLKASLDTLKALCSNVVEKSPNVILDITSFPKRWFFPLVRYFLQDAAVKNFQIIYTRGSEHAGVLSSNPELLRQIPSFTSEDDRTDHDTAFVGVGFHTHSMLELFGQDKAKSLQLLFPFPPGPPGIQRNWKFVEAVELKVEKDESLSDGQEAINYLQLDACDVSQVFDTLCFITNNGNKTSIMAPYGPKPFSLAMCLFAVAADIAKRPEVPMWYSQPQRYAVDYTKDAAIRNSELESWAYAIKRNGTFLYRV